MSCLLESRHEKSVQLISAARQYNQSVIMRHLLWSNTVLFDSGLVKNLEYSLLPPIFSVLHLSVCLSARVSVFIRPFVHLSVYSSVRPSVRPSVCMSVPVRLTAYHPVRLRICVHSNVRKKLCTLGILISTHTL